MRIEDTINERRKVLSLLEIYAQQLEKSTLEPKLRGHYEVLFSGELCRASSVYDFKPLTYIYWWIGYQRTQRGFRDLDTYQASPETNPHLYREEEL